MKMRKLFVAVVALLLVGPVRADEGMWLLPYLSKLNIKDMRANGLKLKADDIYSVNRSSLKDAIVIFGGGCTGEVVSGDGLLLTNHHCGYGQIQALSSVERDFLKNGFWAMSRGEEIPAPGLSVTFVRRMDDVTDLVLSGTDGLGVGEERDAVVVENYKRVLDGLRETFAGLDVEVRDFMGGNQFIAIVSEKFTDVRLVGTPPNSMGKFGGDTDNWMWPRHTDDFSMFRIYAGRDNKPAAYSPDNQPYKAPVHLKISLKGVKENDFAMVIGFPGSTNRYMTTYEMKRLMEQENEARIFVRGERQAIIMEDMLADDAVRLKYAAKYAQSSNYWKNSIGKNKALVENRIPEAKAVLESRFQRWAETDPVAVSSPERYRDALPEIRASVESSSAMMGVYMVLREALSGGIEATSLAQRIKATIKTSSDGRLTNREALDGVAAGFFRNYNEPTDRRVAKRMVNIVRQRIPAEVLPSFYSDIDSRFGGNIDAWVDDVYDRSIFTSEERLKAALDNYSAEVFENDLVAQTAVSIRETILKFTEVLAPVLETIEQWNRVYIKGLTQMDSGSKFYPDANFSMRLTYGSVLPYDPRDGVTYKYYTTLAGVVAKEDRSNPLEFTVEDRIKNAFATGDYGRYGQNGELRINFLTNNDITGGNSGSPVLNARGELIGLAFDGNWEAMSGDIMFDPSLQRCINVDIRYVLWTIDKFAGAGHLLNEMTIVE
jgi:hypothetical protein